MGSPTPARAADDGYFGPRVTCAILRRAAARTYLVLHRWVARVFALLAILHSILALILYKKEGVYEMEAMKSYWQWGIAATMMTVVLAFFNGLPFRKFFYEIWLITHILFSVILIVGCWYHAYDLYAFLGGVFYFLCAASAVWFFDRSARVARLLMMGPRRAKVTELGGDYACIDVPAVRCGSDAWKHVYVYFPTLRPLRFWENHPFSVLPTHLLLGPRTKRRHSDRQSSGDAPHDIEKEDRVKSKVRTVQQYPGAGLTMYIRKVTGMTKQLRANNNLLTFVEGPYPNNSSTAILRCNRILLICGGIGITGLLPFAHNHWNVKLAWSLKESAKCVQDDLEPALAGIADKEIRIGSRLDVEQLIAEEAAAGWERVGVVACGPGGLCDEVRAAVITAAKTHKTEFELEIESYSW
ncbi:hypothetical protein O988_05554 [Pseudogymnoascus sp. VKM F-3808]|nr:hypothetical protein O988_05554 [Pseudogymnoascus sp. VKM F-3808]